MQEETKEQMKKMTNNLVQSATEMNTIMRDAMSATWQSASVMVKGYSDLCETLSSLVQKSIEQRATLSQSMLSASTVDEMVSTQSTMIKSNFDSMMSDMNNITQLSSRIAQQAAEPVTNHVNQTMNKMKKTQAA